LGAEVESYRDSCVRNLAIDENQKQLQLFVNELNDFHSKWSTYLYNFSIDDAEVEKAIEMALSYLVQVRIQEANLEASIFQNKKIRFQKSEKAPEKEAILGKIVSQNVN
jgi:hypothetical protein